MANMEQCILVATEPDQGVLFAKSLTSEYAYHACMGREILRIMNQFGGSVTLRKSSDGYGDDLILADCANGEHLMYKVIDDKGGIE